MIPFVNRKLRCLSHGSSETPTVPAPNSAPGLSCGGKPPHVPCSPTGPSAGAASASGAGRGPSPIRHLRPCLGCGAVMRPHCARTGGEYWTCESECGEFRWQWHDKVTEQMEQWGPRCRCPGRPLSVLRRDATGALWCCCNWTTEGGGCGFSTIAFGAPPPAPRRHFGTAPANWVTFFNCVRLFRTDPNIDLGIGRGRDMQFYRKQYDDFRVRCVWAVHNPALEERYKARREAMLADAKEARARGRPYPALELEARHMDPGRALSPEPLCGEVNEVRLLHGTRLERVLSILQTGLSMRHTGTGAGNQFGPGIYLADNPVKADQYTQEDCGPVSPFGGESSLTRLQKELYHGLQHPKDVHYLLLFKVLCGRVARTVDGDRLASGHAPLWQEHRRKLTPGYDSLLAEVQFPWRRFREFVVFNDKQVVPEYLVAYERVWEWCECRPKRRCQEKTVRRVPWDHCDYQRTFICCPRPQQPCGFKRMLPLCRCGDTARVSSFAPNKWKEFCCGREWRHVLSTGGSRMRWWALIQTPAQRRPQRARGVR